jgi:hypothetical protein
MSLQMIKKFDTTSEIQQIEKEMKLLFETAQITQEIVEKQSNHINTIEDLIQTTKAQTLQSENELQQASNQLDKHSMTYASLGGMVGGCVGILAATLTPVAPISLIVLGAASGWVYGRKT